MYKRLPIKHENNTLVRHNNSHFELMDRDYNLHWCASNKKQEVS